VCGDRRKEVVFRLSESGIIPMTAHSDGISDFLGEPLKPKKPRSTFTLLHLLTCIGIIGLLMALLLPATRSARPAARRMQCVNNLKQIALALHNYESTYKALPPIYTVDAAGKPLHSWRTLILPYLEQQPLYETIDLSKPWNDPANAKAYATEMSQYRCPELNLPTSNTTYLAMVAPNGCFLPDRSRRLSEITDDRGSTLMVIEVDSGHAVHWMAPMDADESLVMGISSKSKLNHVGGMNGAFVNGSVRFLRADFPAAKRRAMISIAGYDNPAGSADD
jgi:type II secretory pathway pseudopilin PulG